LGSSATLRYFDTAGASQAVALEAGELGFTYCQVPVVMALADSPSITLHTADGATESVEGSVLSAEQSEALFKKTGHYVRLDVRVTQVMD
jgi:hypothetical protein